MTDQTHGHESTKYIQGGPLYHYQHYIPDEKVINATRTEELAFEQAQKGNRVRVHYHRHGNGKVECNDKCHDVAKVEG